MVRVKSYSIRFKILRRCLSHGGWISCQGGGSSQDSQLTECTFSNPLQWNLWDGPISRRQLLFFWPISVGKTRLSLATTGTAPFSSSASQFNPATQLHSVPSDLLWRDPTGWWPLEFDISLVYIFLPWELLQRVKNIINNNNIFLVININNLRPISFMGVKCPTLTTLQKHQKVLHLVSVCVVFRGHHVVYVSLLWAPCALTISCRQLTQKWFAISWVRSRCDCCCLVVVFKSLAHRAVLFWLKSSSHLWRWASVSTGWRCKCLMPFDCDLSVVLSDGKTSATWLTAEDTDLTLSLSVTHPHTRLPSDSSSPSNTTSIQQHLNVTANNLPHNFALTILAAVKTHTLQEFNVDWKAECGQLNQITKTKKNIKRIN